MLACSVVESQAQQALQAKAPLGWTCLHYAALRGDHKLVVELLSAKSELDSPSLKGVTPLQIAAARNHPSVVEFLVDAKASLDLADRNKRTPLHWAAEKHNDVIVSQLLQAKADTEKKTPKGWTPLCLAVRYDGKTQNSHEVVALLLDAKARADQVTNNNHTLLHLAHYASPEVVDMILGDPSCKKLINFPGKFAYTPLMVAASKNNEYLVGQLLAAKACPNLRNAHHATAFDVAVTKLCIQSAQRLARAVVPDDHELCSSTLAAVGNNHPCCLELLLHAKADPNEDHQGVSLLGRAVLNEPSAQDRADNTQVLLCLLRAKASPFRQNMTGKEYTTLFTAATLAMTDPGDEHYATYFRDVLQELANTIQEASRHTN